MSTYFQDTNLIEGVNSTVSSGGTLTLTASSKTMQRITGVQNHTVALPDATTLKNVGRRFSIKNRSTGTVTVSNFGGGLIATLSTNTQRDFVVSDVSTSNGVWELVGDSGSTGGGGVVISSSDSLKILQSMATVNYNDGSIVSKKLKFNPEEVGADVWISKNSLLLAKDNTAGYTLNGYGYLPGGRQSGGGALQENPRYDDTNNYWLYRAAFSTTAKYYFANMSLNGYGYNVGGTDSAVALTTVDQYSDTNNAWVSKAAYPVALTEFFGFSLNGFGYVPGGYDWASSYKDTHYVYSDTNNAWYARSKLAQNRANFSMFVLGNFAYASGGFTNSSSPTATVEQFSDATNLWITKASMSTALFGLAGFAINGLGYHAGGYNSGVTLQTAVEVYSDRNNAWLTKSSLSTARAQFGSFDINGYGYALGGTTGPLSTVERYSNSSMHLLGTLLRSNASIATLLTAGASKEMIYGFPIQVRSDGDNWKNLSGNIDSALNNGESLSTKFKHYGSIAYAGGENNSVTVANSETFNQVQNVWTNRTSLGAARGNPYGFNLNGKGYVVGGFSDYNNTYTSPLTNSQSFDDITNVWSSATALTTAAGDGCSFQIRGKGYAVSGWNGSATITTNQSFDSTSLTWTNKTAITGAKADAASFELLEQGYGVAGSPNGINGNGGGQNGSTYAYNAISDAWTTRATTTGGNEYNVSGGSLNGYGYCMGSTNGNGHEKYDPQANTWTNKQNPPSSGANYKVSSQGGYLYQIGGISGASNQTFEYNDGSNAWTTKATTNNIIFRTTSGSYAPGAYRNFEVRVGLPAYVAGFGGGIFVTQASLLISGTNGGGAAEAQGSIYYVGGRNGGSDTNAVQKYSDTANAWTQSFPMSATVSNEAIGSYNGFVYHSNGTVSGSTSGNTYVLNPETGWTSLASSTNTGNSVAGAFLNAYFYVTGGNPQVQTTQQYNPVANSWATKANMNNARGGHGCWNQNGFLNVVGAFTTDKPAEQYDDASNAWTTKASTGTQHSYSGAFSLDGFGYIGGSGDVSTATVEKYNDNSNVWTYAPSWPTSGYNGYGNGVSLNGYGYAAGVGTSGTNYGNVFKLTKSVNNAIIGVALEVK